MGTFGDGRRAPVTEVLHLVKAGGLVVGDGQQAHAAIEPGQDGNISMHDFYSSHYIATWMADAHCVKPPQFLPPTRTKSFLKSVANFVRPNLAVS